MATQVETKPTGWLLSPRAWGTLLAAYWIAMFGLTHLPGHPMPYRPTFADKLGHAIGFSLLTLLVAWVVWLASRRFTLAGGLAIGVGIALYGALDELSQPLVGRSCDLYDWLADAGGITLGLAMFVCLGLVLRRPSQSLSAQ